MAREKYTKIPANTFKHLVVNAGIMLANFTPGTGEYQDEDMLGPTSGGVNFTTTPSFSDWGEDIDNCPKNTKELKRLEDWDVKMSGSFVAVSAELATTLSALADKTDVAATTGENATRAYAKVTPRDTVDIENDFHDIWLVGDYSDVNTGTNAGYIAIRMMNALSTGGFQLQTQDKGKGQFAFEFTGHYSLDAQDTVPYEIYITADAA